jgi:excisionase family DNA binding protein
VKTAQEHLRADEIARLCGVSVRTVRRWIASETLPSVKVGGVRLVPRQVLQQMLAPTLRDWDDSNSENAGNTDDFDCIVKHSLK